MRQRLQTILEDEKREQATARRRASPPSRNQTFLDDMLSGRIAPRKNSPVAVYTTTTDFS